MPQCSLPSMRHPSHPLTHRPWVAMHTLSLLNTTGIKSRQSLLSRVLAFPVNQPFYGRNVAFYGPFHGESEQVRLVGLRSGRADEGTG